MRLFLLLTMISVLLIAGCATQTLPQEQTDQQTTTRTDEVEITGPCPASCDDNDPNTLDMCNEQTGYECKNIFKNATQIAEDVMRDINAALKINYMYVPSKTPKSKVTHFVSYGDATKQEQIVVDVLEYDLKDDTTTNLYFKSQFEGFFMDPLKAERDAFDEELPGKTYHFEGHGYYDYQNHTVDTHQIYKNISYIEELGYYESLYGSVDIATVYLTKHSSDYDYYEKQFFIRVPFNYRVSIICKPNMVVHLYPKMLDYEIQGTNDMVRTQETSMITNQYKKVREEMVQKANKIISVCE